MISTYSPKKVVVSWGAILLSGSFGDGTYIQARRKTDAFSLKVGADGFAARSVTSDQSGEIIVSLMQTSPINALLSAAAVLDEQTGANYFPFLVKDLLGTTLVYAANAWVRKIADVEYDREIMMREWAFETDQINILVGGNPL